MNTKEYITAEIEIIRFSNDDVITTSCSDNICEED